MVGVEELITEKDNEKPGGPGVSFPFFPLTPSPFPSDRSMTNPRRRYKTPLLPDLTPFIHVRFPSN